MSRLPRREGSAQVDEPRRGAGRSCIRRTRRAPSDTGPLSDVDEASPERSRRGTATAAAPPTGRRALAAAIFGGGGGGGG
ncbi:Os05g0241150, partial [Oryza sativa Japonica Group]